MTRPKHVGLSRNWIASLGLYEKPIMISLHERPVRYFLFRDNTSVSGPRRRP